MRLAELIAPAIRVVELPHLGGKRVGIRKISYAESQAIFDAEGSTSPEHQAEARSARAAALLAVCLVDPDSGCRLIENDADIAAVMDIEWRSFSALMAAAVEHNGLGPGTLETIAGNSEGSPTA